MAKLYFRYGTMGSSKTANALMTRHNYLTKGRRVLLLKPRIDNRDGCKTIASRIGLRAECMFVEEFMEDYEKHCLENDAIIVDESQFMTAGQVDTLAECADTHDTTVICYGLKTDFRGQLFEGSKRLIELADDIEEIPTICWCGRKARFNARVLNGRIVRDGEQVELGGDDRYTALCRKHFIEGKISPEK